MSFREYYSGRTVLTVGVEEVLFSETSPYQKIEVLRTDSWGNLMAIDGMVMLSEMDEFVYHEMLAHVPLFSHPDPRSVLIIGGGDGGTAREVLRHPGVQRLDLVEIDEVVIRAARKWLPEVGCFEDPRLHIHIEDGSAFVRRTDKSYDVILVDGSDPVGPARELFSREFLDQAHRILDKQGVLATQAESPWVQAYHEPVRSLFASLRELFPVVRMYLAHIPLYPSGMWSMAYASKGIDPLEPGVLKRVHTETRSMSHALRYYNPEIHSGSFALPNFVRELIDG